MPLEGNRTHKNVAFIVKKQINSNLFSDQLLYALFFHIRYPPPIYQ